MRCFFCHALFLQVGKVAGKDNGFVFRKQLVVGRLDIERVYDIVLRNVILPKDHSLFLRGRFPVC